MNLPHLDPALVAEVAIGAAGLAAWFGLFALALFLTRPADVRPAPPTQEFAGQEPPAVVSLLTNRWELTEDAAESTLIDLAARRILEFRQPGNDPVQTTVHVRQSDPAGLNRYESMIFERVQGLCVSGLVPLTALTFRDQAHAVAFNKRLEAAIVDDARARGLSRRRLSPAVVSALGAAAAIPACSVAGAVAVHLTRVHGLGKNWQIVAVLAGAIWVVLGGLASRPRGERDTPAGREVAGRWLGLRAYLRNDEAFADLPPSAVAVWDRYLSYGDAVGATRVCSAIIDLGLGNRKRVWSSFGGAWHRVKVRYPKFWRRYGQKAVRLFVKAVLALTVSVFVYRGSNALPDRLTADSVAGYVGLAVALLFLSPLFYGVYTLVAAIVDVATPVTLTGEVLWIEVWRTKSGGEDRPAIPWLHHFAIDDGRDDRTVAWGCPSAIVGRASTGDIVTITARRWTRRIIALEVREGGRERALRASASVSALSSGSASASEVTGGILAGVGGRSAQILATALHAPGVAPAQLVTADEVSRALAMQVVAKGSGAVAAGPASIETYVGAGGGRPLLNASVVSGAAAELAMKMRRRAQPLPGIGDEAYAGDGWAIGRRGTTVVLLQLRGDAKRVDPRNVYWLLATAVGRLP